MDSKTVAELDPGIRDLVVALNDAGWQTTDSGDGESKPEDERVFHVRHVVVADPRNGASSDDLIDVADHLQRELNRLGHGGFCVEATYCTEDEHTTFLVRERALPL
jgi:hypothetical protein